MTGKTDYRPGHDAFGRSYADRKMIVGDSSNPLWVGKRGDVPKLFTNEYWCIFEKWRYHRASVQIELNDFEKLAVMRFTEHYESEFGEKGMMIQGFQAVIETLSGIGKMLAKRR